MSRTRHHRRASSVSSLSCSSFDTIEEEYMASEKTWFSANNIAPLPTPASNNCERLQTEMTILACSSPEIQALHKVYYAKNTNTPSNAPSNQEATSNNHVAYANARPASPTSSITSYSSVSKDNACLILAALDHGPNGRHGNDMQVLQKFQTTESVPSTDNHYAPSMNRSSLLHPNQPASRDDNMNFVTQEFAPQSSYHSLEFSFQSPESQLHGSQQAGLNRSCSERLLPHPMMRKPSFHRRVSYDSLPSPNEIASNSNFFTTMPPPSTQPYHPRSGTRVVPGYMPQYQI